MSDTQHIELFTDGACRGNPGPGGWGVLLRRHQTNGDVLEDELWGGEPQTTNNRMELTAAIKGLQAVERDTCAIDITTDSQYLRSGITQWIHNWKAKGWRTANRQPVKNIDLWQELDKQVVCHKINWHWVKAHNGHYENEVADQLANRFFNS